MQLTNLLTKLMRVEPISPGRLYEMISNDHVTVVDENTQQSWIRAHVPGALNLDTVDYSVRDLPADKKSNLVFYCSNPMCRKAPNAALRAGKMGYTSVKVMPAGIRGWISAGLPTESEE
ncbi:rhodanese-like domain-containing protein [soil metagenome]